MAVIKYCPNVLVKNGAKAGKENPGLVFGVNNLPTIAVVSVDDQLKDPWTWTSLSSNQVNAKIS